MIEFPVSPNITSAIAPEKAIGAAESAEQFEALLIEQMLRSMRSAEGEGWMGTGSDASSSSLMEYAEQEISRVIANGGGFGLAKVVRESLMPRSDGTPAAAHTHPNR
jgi:Rod binding domain-containing protein